jgi:RNA polymerase primary sigma factor
MMEGAATAGSDSELELYLQEISKFALLKQHEERELAHRIAEGDKDARDHMVRSNLRLVVSIAKKYMHRGMTLLDLVEEGNLGLLEAVSRFSPDQGCKFSTYGSWWIKQTIRRALINKGKSVRVPAYMVEVMTQWRKAGAALSQKLGREANAEEIGRVLKLSPSKIAAILQALSASMPSGRGANSAEDAPEQDDMLLGIPSREEASSLADYDREALGSALDLALTERERHIMEMRYGLDGEDAQTLERIGERIGLTRERVRQIENQALAKLLLFLRNKDEKDEIRRLARRREHREQRERESRMGAATESFSASGMVASSAPPAVPSTGTLKGARRTRRLSKMRRPKTV